MELTTEQKTEITEKIANSFAEKFISKYGGDFLDRKNFLWKLIDNKWIGKRSVVTIEGSVCWLEETRIEMVRSWWCGGKDADYEEIFTR